MAWTRSGGRVASCLKSRGKIWGAVFGEMKGAEKRAEEEMLQSPSVIGLRGTLHKMLNSSTTLKKREETGFGF